MFQPRSIQSSLSLRDKLLSNYVAKFKFEFSYPYKKDLRYCCLRFGHENSYRNNNNDVATFLQSSINTSPDDRIAAIEKAIAILWS